MMPRLLRPLMLEIVSVVSLILWMIPLLELLHQSGESVVIYLSD